MEITQQQYAKFMQLTREYKIHSPKLALTTCGVQLSGYLYGGITTGLCISSNADTFSTAFEDLKSQATLSTQAKDAQIKSLKIQLRKLEA